MVTCFLGNVYDLPHKKKRFPLVAMINMKTNTHRTEMRVFICFRQNPIFSWGYFLSGLWGKIHLFISLYFSHFSHSFTLLLPNIMRDVIKKRMGEEHKNEEEIITKKWTFFFSFKTTDVPGFYSETWILVIINSEQKCFRYLPEMSIYLLKWSIFHF